MSAPVLMAVRCGRRGWAVVIAHARGGRGVGVARSFATARSLAMGPSWTREASCAG